MKTFALFLLPLALAGAATGAAPDVPGRIHESFDFGWRFSKGDAPGAEAPAFADQAWRKLDLPHDWSIEGPYDRNAPTGGAGGFLPMGVGWYRKHFTLPPALQGKPISVEFDGVYMNSEVWLNGVSLGRWPYGYTSFAFDLTPHLKFGAEANVLAVRVDNSLQPNSRWYSGSGIYRHTWLTVTAPVHLARWGTFITTPSITADAATVHVRAELLNEAPTESDVTLTSEILDAAGTVVATGSAAAHLARGLQALDQDLALPRPQLWSPATPALYRLRASVQTGGVTVDVTETPFGVRELRYDVSRGFLLNGQPVKMLGVCLHHEAGAVGAAVPAGVWERRLLTLKAMGCNALRLSHNPPDPALLDLCDRLGFLVMDEAFDEWQSGKSQAQGNGYNRLFAEWSQRDLVALIRRDRNHPSVVLWSAGNEILEQRQPGGPGVLRPLVETFHREDPTRPVTAAMDNIFNDQGEAPDTFTSLLDIVGYNYVDRWGTRRETFFADDRVAYPQRRFIGTEDTGVGGVRGSYLFQALGGGLASRGGARRGAPATPEAAPVSPAGAPAPLPVRAAYATSTIRVEQLWKFALTHDYVIGHFMWTGIDYLGEAGAWPRKGSTSGALDTCGFSKDAFYFYQSLWTEKPMLHLLPHWNWAGREGAVIPVLAYTNCDVVELFLNGRSCGAKAREFPRLGTKGGWNTYANPQVMPTTADLHLDWDVLYAPGTLRAVGYKNGRAVCEAEVRTAGAPAALRLTVDRTALVADARDVVHATVEVVDTAGTVVPDAANLVTFAVQGPAALIGVDNGDQSSHEDYKADHRQAFAGMCLAIVQAARQGGAVKISASADGLKGATAVLTAAAPADAVASVVSVQE